jgi:hypothetical protein
MITSYSLADNDYVRSWSLSEHANRFISVIKFKNSYSIAGIWISDLLNLHYLYFLRDFTGKKSTRSKELIHLIDISITGLLL